MKKCTTCDEEKDFDNFYKSSIYRDGLSYRCKQCDTKARKAYHEKHYTSVRHKHRANARKCKYGLSSEMFNEMLNKQNNKCAICSVELNEDFGRKHAPNKLVVDHCHSTGNVRGLLCTMCNKALGLFKDNPEVIKNAFNYLKTNNGEIH